MVTYRLGERFVLVTEEDALKLDSDLRLYGNHFVSIDARTNVGERIDPTSVQFKPPVAMEG